jgi:hypothetical protein
MLCAEIHFPKIGQEFSTFEAFKSRIKLVLSDPVVLTQASAKVEYEGKSDAQSGLPNGACEFIALRSPKRKMKYWLKISAEYFDENRAFDFIRQEKLLSTMKLERD